MKNETKREKNERIMVYDHLFWSEGKTLFIELVNKVHDPKYQLEKCFF